MSPARQRIFVVDDEPLIAMTLMKILLLQGYDADQFTDPQTALEAFRRDCPGMLISDVAMPGFTGVELAIQIRSLCPKCRVLLISGQAETADLLRSARERGHDFQLLSKPVSPPYLIATIHRAFRPTV